MSKENVQIVREIYEAVENGDADAVLALYDPEVVWVFARSPFRRLVNSDVYRGHDGLRRFVRERYEEAWSEAEDELQDVIDAGEHVVSVISSRGRGRASGAEVSKVHAGVWTIRGGKVVRVEWMSRDEALEAARLS